MPCGQRACAFGCGGAQEGEVAAAKRLFRGVEEVCVGKDEEVEGHGDKHEEGQEGIRGGDGVDGSVVAEEDGTKTKVLNPRAEVGRSVVADWGRFLMEREREGVARV